MREQIVNKKGLHSTMERVVQSLSENRNISDLDNLERGEWRDFLDDLPDHMYEKETAEAVYFVGCVASFFPSVQTIPEKLVQIFDAAQVDFAILGGEEWCCGFPLIGAGVPDKMQELMEHNLEKVQSLGAKRVIFSCPSCYQTWNEHYDTELELFHSTQFLEKLVGDGTIPLKEEYLLRWWGEFGDGRSKSLGNGDPEKDRTDPEDGCKDCGDIMSAMRSHHQIQGPNAENRSRCSRHYGASPAGNVQGLITVGADIRIF
jgi:hypothetical protein